MNARHAIGHRICVLLRLADRRRRLRHHGHRGDGAHRLSLLLPPLIGEFGLDRGLAAGAFSFGFCFPPSSDPMVGRLMDSRGPRVVIESGVGLMSLGTAAGADDRKALALVRQRWACWSAAAPT